MKRLILVLMLILACSSLSPAQNLSGALSGNLGPGSYTVVDSIWVAAATSLTIAPGTTFNFGGAFGFGIAGALTATGTQADSIKFIPAEGVPFWKGMRFANSASDSSLIEYCVFRGASSIALYVDHVNMNVRHCTFSENASVDYGGGVYNYYSGTTYDHCVFSNNTAVHGGAMCLRYAPPATVTNCVFSGNNGTYGGAIAIYFSAVTMSNSLFFNNSGNNGGAIRFSSATSTVVTNCTFAGNTAAAGWALFNINQIPTLKNLIVYGNTGDSTKAVHVHAGGFTVSYSCIQDSVLWPGIGNMNSNPVYVAGPGGNYYLSQTAAGQPVQSPCVDSGDPASAMITGTTRTDGIQDAGVVDMGYHYAVQAAPPPPLNVTMTPINPPIVIPANGGSFNFNATVERTVGPATPFYAWARNRYPSGNYSLMLLGPVNINPPVGVTVTRQRTQVVDAGWPAGINWYIGYAALTIGYPAIDADSFAWTKSSTADGGPMIWEVANYGEEFPYLVGGSSTPQSFAVIGASPNPFNPTTAISYQLSANSFVSLKVYDTAGRLIATLVNGVRESGTHQVTFDGSGLSSGVYLYSLTAGSHIASGKMVLLK